MKIKPTLILLILLSFFSCEKKDITATINITIELENKNTKGYPDLRFLKIYKNGIFYKEIKAEHLPFIPYFIKLENLKEGKYQFEYTNIFQQKVVRELNIDESKIYKISINPDYSDYKQNFKKSLIFNLKENQSLKLTYKSQGCFHHDEDIIIIHKKENHYELERNGTTIKLNNKEINYLIRMECELNNIKTGGCTTSDIYTFYGDNYKKEFIDSSCKWNGWDNLKTRMKWK